MSWEAGLRQHRLTLAGYLGSGAFGDTYLVHDASGAAMALKRSRHTLQHVSSLEEVFGLRRLCCWHTTTLHDAWLDAENHVNILMEYCNVGNLRNYLDRCYPLPAAEVCTVFAQALLALDHLHKKKIIHRDIKLDNILLSTTLDGAVPSVKLADFGLAKQMSDEEQRAVSHVGTPSYVPPETASGYSYTAKSDIWSLGVVMYTVLTNQAPFPCRTSRGVRRLRYCVPPHPCLGAAEYRKELGDCVMAMLHAKWKRRPSAESLLRCAFLRETLCSRAWMSPRFPGVSWVFVRPGVPQVAVHRSHNIASPVTRCLTAGDQVLLSRAFHDGTERWSHVELPFNGFIRVTAELHRQLDSFSWAGLAEVLSNRKHAEGH